jgi:membrane protein DedA with SNARE-associated domain
VAAGGRGLSIEAILAQWGIPAIFVGAGVEGETVVVTGGLLAHQGLVPLWAAMVAAVTGSFVADQLFFLAGRRFRDRRFVKRLRDRPAFAHALATFERHPAGFIVGFRFLYGLRTISPIAIGTTKVSTRRFMVLNLVAAIGWGVIFTSLGYVFGDGLTALLGRLKPDRHTLLAGAGLVLIVFLLVRAVLWWRRRT